MVVLSNTCRRERTARSPLCGHRLHRALMPDTRFRFGNAAELDSVERWREVIGSAEFRTLAEQMSEFPPGLYQVVSEHRRDT